MTASRPILVCYDGSEQSQRGLEAIRDVLAPTDVVILTVWEPLVAKLSETGSFGVFALEGESEVDRAEEQAARAAAEDGARRAAEHGHTATARVEEARSGVAGTIIEVADELDARLVVCGTRGRSPLKTALLGSVSHAVLTRSHRPVLISPAPHDG